MSPLIRSILLGLACVVIVVVAFWATSKPPEKPREAAPRAAAAPAEVLIDNRQIADAGLILANQFTGAISDPASLDDLREAIAQRGPGGLAALRDELARIEQAPSPKALSMMNQQIASLQMYEGQYGEAAKSLEKAMLIGDGAGMPTSHRANLEALLGIVALRRGELDNCIECLGPSSCILPISRDAIHTRPDGSKEAIRHFTACLEATPGDVRVRWLLNLAYMTLGEYPEKVPPEYLVPLDTFESKADAGRFRNVAPLVGLTSRGPNQAGGSVFDDFTGDGLPDLLVTSLDVDRGTAFYVNLGNGKFEDRSEKAGLDRQIYALNASRADFDNDGRPDVVLLRGAWEKAMRLTLLRNTGNDTFEDVTIESGLGEPIPSESAVWGDYDNDGLVDLYVCGESRPPFSRGEGTPDPRNRCRLYHNEGNGKFVDVAARAGVAEDQCSKGSAWGDYDGDGYLDLFVSSMNAPCRLYHNEKDGTFRDVARELGVTGPEHSFACWFWDYDNDGRLDLYVNDYSSSLAHFAAANLKEPIPRASRPHLYRNEGSKGFRDVTAEVGLDRVMMPMGANFADIDNDGFLDLYFGTGRMALEVLVPNLMFKNDAGRRFDDVTISSGTGHLQKGHGISFADWDCDGDLDLFVEAGGAVPGDRAFNVLFQNPGHGRHWLKIRLVGSKSNRSAFGARIKAVIRNGDGTTRSVYRTIGNNGSFGGNSLVESIGLLDATRVEELEVIWPTSQTTQVFRDIAADQAIEITEGNDSFSPLPQPWRGASNE